MKAYTQKLDSVIGSDDFDRVRWKNVYSYQAETEVPQGGFISETCYNWEDETWVPTVRTEMFRDGANDHDDFYSWNENEWEIQTRVNYVYLDCNGQQLLEDVITERWNDSVWLLVKRSNYLYDNQCHPVLNMIYNGLDEEGNWVESAKYENTYNENGQLTCQLYSTIRNGVWRESMKDTLMYENGLCVSLLNRRKGNGPGGGSWRDSGKYEFEYQDGELVSETYYSGGWGWMVTELTLDSRTHYQFDAFGNEVMKTASVYNEQDWVVRDSYENSFDNTVSAASVLGLASVWETILNKGMSYVLDMEMPLYGKWLTCAISSSNLDTQFSLYCSGFEQVDEYQETGFAAFGKGGAVVVQSLHPCQITVYDLLGRVVASQSQVTESEFHLAPGLYLVDNGASVVKAVVR